MKSGNHHGGDMATNYAVPKHLREAVYRRDSYTCIYCGSTDDLTADHVIPRAKGGPDELWNLVTACRKCNGTKQDKIDVRLTKYSRKWLDYV